MKFPLVTKNYVSLFLVWALLTYLLLIHTRAFPTQDESWMLQASARLFTGEVPYLDFQFIYHPFSLYLNAVGYFLFGVSVFASRLMAVALSVISVMSIWWLSRRWQWPTWLSVTTIAGYLFWGPTHINFVWPVMICLTTGLITAVLWQRADLDKAHTYWWLGFVGVVSALTLLTKQNFGVAILAVNGLYALLTGQYKDWKKMMALGSGFGVICGLQLWYWLSTDSLGAFINDMNFLLIERVIKQGVLNSAFPWDYPGPLLYRLAKFGFYILPLLFSLSGLLLAWLKKQQSLLFVSLLSGAFYLFSIRPTTDIVHLVPLMAISLVPLSGMYVNTTGWLKKAVLVTLICLTFFGAYHGLIKNYYRWDMPLWQQNYYFDTPSAKVWVNPGVANQMIQLQTFFESLDQRPSQIFVYNYAPYLYLLLDARNPTRFDYLHTGVLSPETEQEIMTSLETKQQQYILTNTLIKPGDDVLSSYIFDHYVQVKEAGEYAVWRRR